MKSILLIFLLSFFSFQSKPDFISDIKLPFNADYFQIDNLGNIYIVKGARLMKIKSGSKEKIEYSNFVLGSISSIDVSNPLRILVYYHDANQILFLNNKLSELSSPVLLDDADIFDSQLICSSAENRIWVYDSQDLRLKQLNDKMELVKAGTALDRILDDINTANILFEKDEFVYLNIPETGVLVFDSFGTYYKTFPKKAIVSFQVFGNLYFYQIADKYFYFDTDTFEDEEIEFLNNDSFTEILSYNHKFYLLSDSIIKIYQ